MSHRMETEQLENTVPFKQRVMDFWDVFFLYEPELRRLLDTEAEPLQSRMFVYRMLQNLFGRPFFNLKRHDDYYELNVSPDGSGSRLYQLAYWRMQAPEALMEHWEFTLGTQAVEFPEEAALDVEGFRLVASDVQVWPVLQPDGRMGIEGYSKELNTIGPSAAYTAFCLLLERSIGELCLMSNIEYVNVLMEPALEPCILLSELADYIADMQMKGQLPPLDDPLGLFTSYTMEPAEEMVYVRDDIYFGNTSAAALAILNGYQTGEDVAYDDAAQEGTVWGFLFFDSTGIDEEQRVNVRAAIEEELNRVLMEQGIGECVGSASGYQYAYLDFITYDWEAFLEIAEETLEPFVQLYQIPVTGAGDFRKEGKLYALNVYKVPEEEHVEMC